MVDVQLVRTGQPGYIPLTTLRCAIPDYFQIVVFYFDRFSGLLLSVVGLDLLFCFAGWYFFRGSLVCLAMVWVIGVGVDNWGDLTGAHLVVLLLIVHVDAELSLTLFYDDCWAFFRKEQ